MVSSDILLMGVGDGGVGGVGVGEDNLLLESGYCLLLESSLTDCLLLESDT